MSSVSAPAGVPPIPVTGGSVPTAPLPVPGATAPVTGGGATSLPVDPKAEAGGAVDAAKGVMQLPGGDVMGQIITILTSLVEVLTQLVSAIAGQNGGPVDQVPPKGGDVGGETGDMPADCPMKGGVVQQTPPKGGDVGGDSGFPVQQTPPAPAHKRHHKDGKVGGESGDFPGQQTPPKGGVVDGESGGVVQQTPPPVPGGGPIEPPKPPDAPGQVKLYNYDAKSPGHRSASVELRGSNGNSVLIWGDPHVEVTLGGKTQKFNIGYGPGTVELKDGTVIEWTTFGGKNNFRLRVFKIDDTNNAFDTRVSTTDGKDVVGQMTGLTNAQLAEFGRALLAMKGPVGQPLIQPK